MCRLAVSESVPVHALRCKHILSGIATLPTGLTAFTLLYKEKEEETM